MADAQRDREFAEQTAHDATHQQNGNEDRDQRGAHGEHGESDFARALQSRLHRRHALLRDGA